MEDTLKTVSTSAGTLIVNFWNLVPELLGIILLIVNIVYVAMKIKKGLK